ncbi:unnamed protein product [Urochloa decumbens]|uniref:Glycosyltransferase n=1 Tax=Urochloa decumbens TaxID=240449 RepID=A0ABC8VNI8_9POAL
MGSMAAPPCHLVAVPYPGRGHVNAMLNLCRILTARDGVSATVVLTEEWLGLLGSPPAGRVRFEAIPNVIPSEHGRAADMPGFLEAVYTRMAAPFERLLDRLPAPPHAIVADVFVPWTVAVGARRGVPVCAMCPLSATMFAVQYSFHRLPPAAAAAGGGSPDGIGDCLIEDYIPGTKSIRFADLAPTHTNPALLDRVIEAYSTGVKKAQCVIFTSFQELESDAIAAIRQELPCPVYAVGPCIPFMALQQEEDNKPNNKYPDGDGDGHMAWLDAQPAGSVLYVSLGSFLSVSSAQLDEIAGGLAASGARFLWVLRDAGARARVARVGGGRGVAVPWTDQLRVLCHPSVGGFFTHSGMNSTLEAVYAGVPMLTLPIAFDQPTNSRLVAEVWKTGIGLKETTAQGGVVGREEIAAAVERLMRPGSAEAVEMRKRASLLKDAARAACEEGGSSWKDVTSFIRFVSS